MIISMRPAAKFSLGLSTLALIAVALPSQANVGSTAALPAACAGQQPKLEEGQNLVERTLYFHGTSRSGDVDNGNDIVGSPLLMDTTKPTGADDKYKTSKPLIFGNDKFASNGVNGYWRYNVASEDGEEVVCAAVSFWAIAPGNTINSLLFLDQARATQTGANYTAAATASGAAQDGPRQFTATYGRFGSATKGVDATYSTIVAQFAPPAPGAVLVYDSAARPSSLTYVIATPSKTPELVE